MDIYLALEQKFNQLQNENNGLTRGYNMVKNELQLLQNASSEHDRKFRDLQQIGNIKPLQEIGTLQHTVQTNTATMQSLSMNERARSQDFLALYNLTMELKSTHALFKKDVINQLTTIRVNHNMNLSNLSSEIQANEKHNNLSVALMEGKITDINNILVYFEANYNVTVMEIQSKIDKIETQTTSTILSLKKRMDEKVALTSHISSTDSLYSGKIMKFDKVAFSVGINNLSLFKSSGKFVVETPGLYLISVSVAVHVKGNPEFSIVLNDIIISETEMGEFATTSWRSGTNMVSRHLVVNDSIWVQCLNIVYTPENGDWSQFTIIKIN